MTVHNGFLLYMYCIRIVVPKLHEITEASQWTQGTLTSVWWPRLSSDIREMIQHCPECLKKSVSLTEPMIPFKLPDYPWQKVASDLFELKGVTYLLDVDYFSHFPEVAKLTTMTSTSVIAILKTSSQDTRSQKY